MVDHFWTFFLVRQGQMVKIGAKQLTIKKRETEEKALAEYHGNKYFSSLVRWVKIFKSKFKIFILISITY